jgi:hypothetical protein
MCVRWLRGLLLGIAVVGAQELYAQAIDAAYQIKASYIYNLLQFVHFPKDALRQGELLTVCILGEDRFGEALDQIDGSKVPDGRMHIVRLGRYSSNAELNRCNVLYLIDSEQRMADKVIARIDSSQVLTIGEFSPFIRHGGLIELFEQDDVIRFRVNEQLVNKTDFKIDAQLVQLGVK